jgi:hypothetical protein
MQSLQLGIALSGQGYIGLRHDLFARFLPLTG